MKMRKTISYFALVVFLFLSHAQTIAQCAMCKASVESDLNSGGSIGTKLNTGILYLMAIPYIILVGGAYLFFKKPIDEKIKAGKEKHFPRKQAS
jgi:hypothetical protein